MKMNFNICFTMKNLVEFSNYPLFPQFSEGAEHPRRNKEKTEGKRYNNKRGYLLSCFFCNY